jgi:serine protease AprX
LNLDAVPDDLRVWVHGQALSLPAGQWPAGQTPRAVLRLSGPVQAAWRASLARTGLTVQFWCPPHGVCIDMPLPYRKAPARLAELGFVLAGCDYTESLCQRFATAEQALPASQLPPDLFDVICFKRSLTGSAGKALVKLGADVLHIGTTKLRVRFAGDPALLREVPGVKLVDVVRLPVLLSASELRSSIGAQASMPGSWALDGQGEVIAVADTGLDSGDALKGMHPDFADRIRALISLPMNPTWADFAQPRTDDAADRASGHGTHVAGLAAGSGAASKGVHGGLAPAAQLVFQAMEQQVAMLPGAPASLPSGYYLAGRPVDLRDLYRQAAAQGATLFNLSWGDATQGAYSDDCFETDLYLREAPLALIVCAAGNDGTDRDGNRRIDSGSLYAPASAKNTLAVGATEGPLQGQGSRATWGQLDPQARRWPALADRNDPVSGEPDRIAPFSSCGPTRDGRIKPDLCAPGTNLPSTRSRQTTFTGWGLADPLPLYMYDGGTSMAAPVVTGAMALVRQAWRREWHKSHRTPTGAALKALALLACVPVRARGAGWATPAEVGFGRLDVGRTLPPSFHARPGWQVSLRDAATQKVDTGQHRDITLRLSQAGRLRAVLCWIDPPGERLINDLDLSLHHADGPLLACGACTPGISLVPDRSNPVECIDIPHLPAGRHVLRVSGFNVMDGPQRYALAWAIDTSPP